MKWGKCANKKFPGANEELRTQVDKGEVLGIFTALDGLRILASLSCERSKSSLL